MEIKLDSIENALELLRDLNNDNLEINDFNLTLSGELEFIQLIIDGPHFFGTVTGELTKGIYDYQVALYRAAAFALYGTPDSRRLNYEQRNQLELVFKVTEGSSNLLAPIVDSLNCLKECLSGMSSRAKAITIISVALILAGGYTYIQKNDNDTKIAIAQEETKRGETIKDTAIGVLAQSQIANQYAEANKNGLISIAKSAKDATSICLGKSKLDIDAIKDINRKAERTKPTAEIPDGPFIIHELDIRESGLTSFSVCDNEGREYTVSAPHTEFQQDQLSKIWSAASSRQPVNLTVNLTVASDGTIRKTQLISID